MHSFLCEKVGGRGGDDGEGWRDEKYGARCRVDGKGEGWMIKMGGMGRGMGRGG